MGDYAIVGYDTSIASSSAFTYSINAYNANLQFPFNTTVTLPNADVFAFDGTGKVLSGTAARGANEAILSVTVNNATPGTKIFTYATQEPGDDEEAMQLAGGFIKTKTEATLSLTLTGQWGSSLTSDGRGSTSDTLYLNGYVDAFQLPSITGTKGASSGISLNSHFTFDNGQRESFYDWSR